MRPGSDPSLPHSPASDGGILTASTPPHVAASGAKLAAAERQAALLRARVSGAIAQAGWTLIVFGLTPGVLFINGIDLEPTAGACANYWGAMFWGFPVLFLALRPTDAARIANACRFLLLSFTVFVSLLIFVASSPYLNGGNDPINTGSLLATALLFGVCAAALAPTLVARRGKGCARSAMPPRRKLQQLWFTLRLCLFGGACTMLVIAIGPAIRDGLSFASVLNKPMNRGVVITAGLTLLAALVFTPANRGRVHRWLGALGKSGSKQQEAAAVASLIGRRSGGVAAALATAKKCFRAQPLHTLSRENLLENKPDPKLHEKTVSATLGAVDAFVSHSWSDEGGAKFDALHEWAGEGADKKLVWLDKACIDQLNIDASLACLPIFLAGCRQLLILLGPTYPSRLWCVMELFVYVRMGGTRADIVVKLLDETTDLAQSLARFDAGKAKCFLDRDKQKLWAVIEASFGTFHPFNKLVRGIFAEQLVESTKSPTVPKGKRHQVAPENPPLQRLKMRSYFWPTAE